MQYRYFIELEFKGSAYCGWQVQPNEPTVQHELNSKLSTILRAPIETVGAGRTDTGVHASYYVAHFDCSYELKTDLTQLARKLNNFLPTDIYISRIIKMQPDAHARFDATSRTYNYYISSRKDPFRADYCWQLLYPLDIELMNKGAKLLQETIDFTSFSKLHTDVKTNNCFIKNASWSKQEHLLVFTIEADRFLRNMVRAIVGTLVDIGRNKITISDLTRIISAKDRSLAGESAPAQGLFLNKIEYPYSF